MHRCGFSGTTFRLRSWVWEFPPKLFIRVVPRWEPFSAISYPHLLPSRHRLHPPEAKTMWPKFYVLAMTVAIVLLTLFTQSAALFASYGICQTGCNGVACACYAASGATFGTVTAGIGVPAAIAACNAALGTCMAACVAALIAPIP